MFYFFEMLMLAVEQLRNVVHRPAGEHFVKHGRIRPPLVAVIGLFREINASLLKGHLLGPLV